MEPLLKGADPIPLALAAIVGLFLSSGIYPFYIRWLKEKQIGQYIREEGPQSHAIKAKTPTMGGIAFAIITIFVSLWLIAWSDTIVVTAYPLSDVDPDGPKKVVWTVAIIAIVGTLCSALGLADDYNKVTSKSNTGLSARFRLISEILLGYALAFVLWFVKWPFSDLCLGVGIAGDGSLVPLAWQIPEPFNYIFLLTVVPFLVAATTNAVNLHDGMDGLAGGTSAIVFGTLAFMLFSTGKPALAWMAAACCGSLLGFLIYNRYPAKLFMGDTGSLFLGGLMAGLVAAGGLTLWFIPLSLIYIVESISVMAQVAYFKLTKPYEPEKPMSSLALALYKLTHRLPGEGKRLLKMAPMHHHFEAVAAEKGQKEWHVVLWFWLIQLGIASAVCLGFSRPF